MNSRPFKEVYSAKSVKDAARGREIELLRDVAGIPDECLTGKHGPCPLCGGKDRFRLVDREAGAVFCNQCFSENNGDFLAAITHFRKVDFSEAVRMAGERMGVRPEGKPPATGPRSTVPAGDTGKLTFDIKKPEAVYDYTDEQGRVLFQVLRFAGVYQDETPGKTFLQRRPDPDKPGKWIWKGIDQVRQVPYKLPKLAGAKIVFYVEGEKDADRLNRLFMKTGCYGNVIATTSARGAKNSSHWPDFVKEFSLDRVKGRVIPDNDPDGLSFGRAVCRAILQANATYDPAKGESSPALPDVKLLTLPDMPHKGDVSDWIDRLESEGKTPSEIVQALDDLCRVSPAITDEILLAWGQEEKTDSCKEEAEPPTASEKTPLFITALDIFESFSNDVLFGDPPQAWKISDNPDDPINRLEYMPGRVILIGGHPGSGKTALVIQTVFEALQMSKDLRALICNVEVPPATILERILASRAGVPLADIMKRRRHNTNTPAKLEYGLGIIKEIADRISFVRPAYSIERIEQAANKYNANLIVLDYVQRIKIEENRALPPKERIAEIMDKVRLQADAGRCVICISALARPAGQKGQKNDYKGAGIASFRDSSELEFGCDSAWILDELDEITGSIDTEKRHLRCVKNRSGARADIYLDFDGKHQFFFPYVEEKKERPAIGIEAGIKDDDPEPETAQGVFNEF